MNVKWRSTSRRHHFFEHSDLPVGLLTHQLEHAGSPQLHVHTDPSPDATTYALEIAAMTDLLRKTSSQCNSIDESQPIRAPVDCELLLTARPFSLARGLGHWDFG